MWGQNQKNKHQAWIILERALFVLGLLLLAHPFLKQRYFFTVDGPSHVYDAWLILELFHPSAGVHASWEINPLPVPDWSGHAILALLLTIVKPPEALKVVHLLCVLGFVIAFRMVVAQRMKGPLWLSFLAFPFAFSAPFAMGYFNFCLALPLVMLIMRQWRRIMDSERSRAGWFGLSTLLLACYFSHLMPFLFAVLWTGAQLIERWWLVLVRKEGGQRVLRQTLFLGLAVLPSFILLAWYLSCSPDGSSWADPEKNRLEQIWKPFVLVEKNQEFVLWAAALLLVLLAFSGGFHLMWKKKLPRWPGTTASLTYATAMLLSMFVLPDGFGKGSDILFRLSVLVHIAFLAAIPFARMAPRWGVALAMASLLVAYLQAAVRAPVQDWQTAMLKSTTELCSKGTPGRTACFIWTDWSNAHLPELGFTCSKAIDYTHYELNLAHFPLRWRREHVQMLRAAPSDTLDALGEMSGLPGAILRSVDEIVVVGEPRDDRQLDRIRLLERELSTSYAEGRGNGECRIFWRVEGAARQ